MPTLTHCEYGMTGAMAAQIYLFPCLKDNFGVLIHDPESGATAAIDVPEAAPVEAALKKTGWRLSDILVTHHHADHTQGIGEIKSHHKCRVVAPRAEAARIAHVDETVAEGDKVAGGALAAQGIDTPGHTAGHISYFFPVEKLAFVGDTLFSIGCGSVIEGTPEMMWDSLLKLRALPDDTRFYCAPNKPWPISASPKPSGRTTRRWKHARRKWQSCWRRASPPFRLSSRPKKRPIRSCARTTPRWPM